ncbi:tetratricopeptide repeat protein [Patescibacteria group bacterium]|nr:tetratricopeptide repeat protein [Patescibacteria group bacterium]
MLGSAFAEKIEFKENDAHKLVDKGIDYCKTVEKVWSDYKVDQYCRKALRFFRKALRIGGLTEQELINVYLNQGVCYGYMRCYDKAAESFSKALKLDPRNTLALLNRAINYANIGERDKAIEDLEKVIVLDTHSPQGEFAQKAEEILDCL